jgi:hypothetical protein
MAARVRTPPRRAGARPGWAALVLSCTLLSPSSLHADDDAQTRMLRLRFAQGIALEGASRWADALDRFEDIAHVRATPHVRFHIALCHDRLGRLLHAQRLYHDARAAARASAPAVIPEIENRLQDLDARIPRLALVIAGTTEGVTVQLDGARVDSSKLLRVDPGPHIAVAARHGVPVAASAFSILERRTKVVSLMVYPPPRENAHR